MRQTICILGLILTGTIVASASRAEVILSLDLAAALPTPGLPGYRTYTVTATSSVPGETIAGVDMIGDPAAPVDPNTSRGFFVAMNQVLVGGAFPTPFGDFNALLPQPLQDSQFLVATNSPTVPVQSPAGFSRESATSLQALFSRDTGFGQSFPLAQLVFNPSVTPFVDWRGVFAVNRGGSIVDLPEASGEFYVGPAVILPDIFLNALGERELSAGVINAQGNAMGTGPQVWSNLTQTRGPPVAIDATLSDTGAFQWNPTGSLAGKKGSGAVKYQWTATLTTPFPPAATEVAFEVILIPEPATISLIGLAMVGFVGVFRRRG